MAHRPTTLERAFELADTGEHPNSSSICKQLEAEGYANVQGQLYGRSVRADLLKRCRAARERLGNADGEGLKQGTAKPVG